MKNKKCEHTWTCGTPTFKSGQIKIKTKCDLCGKIIIVDFKNQMYNDPNAKIPGHM